MLVRELDENIIADIGHAFGYYDYGAETGLVSLYPSRDDAAEYICAYVRAALRGGFLHTVGERGEAYIAYKRPGDRISIRAVWPVVMAEFRGKSFSEVIGLIRQIVRLIRLTKKGGTGLDDRFKKAKKPYLFVGMVCVREAYQGQGFMRKLMELAFDEGNRLGVPVILDTDAKSKCEKYIHLGMELAGIRDFGEYGKIYDLIKYPDANGNRTGAPGSKRGEK